jgi:hypothetical protein
VTTGTTSGKTPTYSALRVAYLSAVSRRLRPTFWEDEEDFLDSAKRAQAWEQRQGYNTLKQVWITYDRLSLRRDLSAEDQEIENDLDLVEEEIQEKWHEVAEELLEIIDLGLDHDEVWVCTYSFG